MGFFLYWLKIERKLSHFSFAIERNFKSIAVTSSASLRISCNVFASDSLTRIDLERTPFVIRFLPVPVRAPPQ